MGGDYHGAGTAVKWSLHEQKNYFSAVTFDAMMYVTERMFEAGCPIIIEGNFVPAGVKKVDEAGVIRKLIDQYGYNSLTFQFKGDTQVLHKRFVLREETLERGQVNKIGSEVSYDEFDGWCHDLDSFDVGGKIVSIDTTDFDIVNFEGYLEIASEFMGDR